ncbi:hypothetical protein ScPMuIL_012348 [Solemya velum]
MATYVVVGGGIAGVSCTEILSLLCPEDSIILITASALVKAVTNVRKVTKMLEIFDVEEKPMISVQSHCPNVNVIHATVKSIDATKHCVLTSDGQVLKFEKLCICSGGKPKVIAEGNPYVLGIRDTESAKQFQKKLKAARRVVVVGNGGIATELVYEIEGCEVVWAIKDKAIASTFVDAGAAEFFMPQLSKCKHKSDNPKTRLKYTLEQNEAATVAAADVLGGALGPDWACNLDMTGVLKVSHSVFLECEVEVRSVYSAEGEETVLSSTINPNAAWPVFVELTNGRVYGCDLIVSATGVLPSTDFLQHNSFDFAEDGGVKVDDMMRTSVPDVYAAGDVCTASWDIAPHWLQMRLWGQARQMGGYAAKCMHAAIKQEPISQDFCFELFAHATRFFDYKVILLGRFNAQGLGEDYELLLRVTKGEEYVKVVLKDGRMQGAVLIGETDLEETFENLILNQLDLTPFKDHMLEPGIDIEDYFD